MLKVEAAAIVHTSLNTSSTGLSTIAPLLPTFAAGEVKASEPREKSGESETTGRLTYHTLLCIAFGTTDPLVWNAYCPGLYRTGQAR